MVSVSRNYLILDVFSALPGITYKNMFGGCCFYKDGIIFACIADGKLYFKADAETRSLFDTYESSQFVYESKHHKITPMPYWELPEQILEDQEQLKTWIEASVAASLRLRKKHKVKSRIVQTLPSLIN